MKKFLGLLALSIGAVASSSCENIPIGAYSLASDPLPDHAQLVTQDQYAQLQKSSLFFSISNQSIGEQQQAAARDERDNDVALGKFAQAHPKGPALLPPLPREPGIIANPDDTYTHTITLNNGRTVEVRTMGRRWAKATVRRAIDVFPSRANQLSTYQMYYDALALGGGGDRADLGLPDPVLVQKDTETYSAGKILELNDRIAAQASQTPPSFSALPHQIGAPLCTREEGVGNGSDRVGSDDSDAACAPQSNGLFAHYDWPSKGNLTCVKDQANRGTCVSFATTSALENLVSKTQNRFVNLSEQYLYQQAKLGLFRDDFNESLVGWSVLSSMVSGKWQIPFETSWEYNPSRSRVTNNSTHLYTHSCDGYAGSCSDSSHQMQVYCSNNGTARYCGFLGEPAPAQGFALSSTSELWNLLSPSGSVAKIAAAVNLGQPVILGFSVTPSWDGVPSGGFVNYKSGESNRGGHAVHVVGAIDNATLARIMPSAPAGSGGGYLIIKNSWSSCWSDGGFVYVPYDFVSSYANSADAVTN